VKVEIAGIEERPGAVELRYVARNDGAAPVWVVDDGWLAWRPAGHRIELVYARVPIAKGTRPFGYFPPQTAQLAAGAALEREVSLTFPQPLSRLWNDRDEADPEPGAYEVAVRIGYGETPQPGPPELGQSVEAPVLAWQHEAVSEPVPLRISRP
jgi:hypothetical protein